jgi:hypothetical protein
MDGVKSDSTTMFWARAVWQSAPVSKIAPAARATIGFTHVFIFSPGFTWIGFMHVFIKFFTV